MVMCNGAQSAKSCLLNTVHVLYIVPFRNVLELLSDNQKMAELLSSSQSDCNHAAALIERLTNENNQLKK